MNEDNAETIIPDHPHFELVAHSLQEFGKWGRRVREQPGAYSRSWLRWKSAPTPAVMHFRSRLDNL